MFSMHIEPVIFAQECLQCCSGTLQSNDGANRQVFDTALNFPFSSWLSNTTLSCPFQLVAVILGSLD